MGFQIKRNKSGKYLAFAGLTPAHGGPFPPTGLAAIVETMTPRRPHRHGRARRLCLGAKPLFQLSAIVRAITGTGLERPTLLRPEAFL
jgi:hypothetical protein